MRDKYMYLDANTAENDASMAYSGGRKSYNTHPYIRTPKS